MGECQLSTHRSEDTVLLVGFPNLLVRAVQTVALSISPYPDYGNTIAHAHFPDLIHSPSSRYWLKTSKQKIQIWFRKSPGRRRWSHAERISRMIIMGQY
ncbi:unnamed protein product [Caretta caretta]